MIKIQQVKEGKVIYKDDIESYNYSVPQFIDNGAIKIIIKYPTTTIVITPNKITGELNES